MGTGKGGGVVEGGAEGVGRTGARGVVGSEVGGGSEGGSLFTDKLRMARVQGSGFRVQGSGFMVQGSGFRVQGLGFRVQGLGFRV